jgi:hypothetical protein
VERITALVRDERKPAEDALVLRCLPERLLVPQLERLEPDALALES